MAVKYLLPFMTHDYGKCITSINGPMLSKECRHRMVSADCINSIAYS